MVRLANTYPLNDEIEDACEHFLEQANLLIPLDTLTVVLSDANEETRRVAFSWTSPLKPTGAFAVCPIPPVMVDGGRSTTINLPIRGNYSTLGSVLVRTPLTAGLTTQQQRLIGDILNLLAIRLENIQLHQRVQDTNREIDLVDEIARIITSAEQIDDVYPQFANAVQKLIAFDRISIYVIRPETEKFTVKYIVGPTFPGRMAGDSAPLAGTTTGYLWQTGRTIIRTDTANDPKLRLDQTTIEEGFKSAINIPLIANRAVIGVLGLHSLRAHSYGSREQAILERLASQIAPAIENVYWQEKIQAASLKAKVLDEVTSIVGSAEDLGELFSSLSNCLSKSIGFDQASLSWIASSRNDYSIDFLQTTGNPASAKNYTSDSSNHPIFSRLAVPLSHHGDIIGSLELRRKDPPFSGKEQDILRLVGNQIAPAVYNVGLHQLTIRQAYQLQYQSESVASLSDTAVTDMTQNTTPMADLAHALYSPLTSIKGYTGSLLQPDSDWPEEVRQEFLRTIHQAADRLDHAIRDLVLPTHRETSPKMGQPAKTQIQEIFKQLELELSDSATGVSISFICDPDLPPVDIDPRAIGNVIRHMIDCAISYTSLPADFRVLAAIDGGSVNVSLEFTILSQQPAQPSLDTDLRVVVCRKILGAIGTTLNVQARSNGAVRLWFNIPMAHESEIV